MFVGEYLVLKLRISDTQRPRDTQTAVSPQDLRGRINAVDGYIFFVDGIEATVLLRMIFSNQGAILQYLSQTLLICVDLDSLQLFFRVVLFRVAKPLNKPIQTFIRRQRRLSHIRRQCCLFQSAQGHRAK